MFSFNEKWVNNTFLFAAVCYDFYCNMLKKGCAEIGSKYHNDKDACSRVAMSVFFLVLFLYLWKQFYISIAHQLSVFMLFFWTTQEVTNVY